MIRLFFQSRIFLWICLLAIGYLIAAHFYAALLKYLAVVFWWMRP